jgi:hypothetical protein
MAVCGPGGAAGAADAGLPLGALGGSGVSVAAGGAAVRQLTSDTTHAASSDAAPRAAATDDLRMGIILKSIALPAKAPTGS